MFFQKLKHRARECASVLLYDRNRIFAPKDYMLPYGGFPDRELTNFPNVGGYRVLQYYCSAEVRRVRFRSLSNARIPRATRKRYVS